MSRHGSTCAVAKASPGRSSSAVAEGASQLALDRRGDVVAAGDVPVGRDDEVEVDPMVAADVAVAEFVVRADVRRGRRAVAAVGVEQRPQEAFVARVLLVEQAGRRPADQGDGFGPEVARECHGGERVEPTPSR